MLTSFSVTCPNELCGWNGSLIPSIRQGGMGAEVDSTKRAWFRCPRCLRDWEVQITDDRVTFVSDHNRDPQ
jgi:hypothetical protein